MRTVAFTLGLALLLASFWRQGEIVIAENGQSFDEAVHLAAGCAYWKTGHFEVNAEDPPLLKLWWALPFVLSGDGGDLRSMIAETEADEWLLGNKLLHESGRSPDALLNPARRMNLAVGCGVVLVAGVWSFRLWNNRLAGVGAAAFAAFDPNLLALACNLSTDCGLAFFSLLTCYLLWEYSAAPSRGLMLATGVSTGLLLATKFSAIAVVGGLGLAGLLFVVRGGTLAMPGKPGGIRTAWELAFRLLLIGAITLTAAYGFIHFPEWGHGFHFQMTRGGRGDGRFFLLGEHSATGWYHYFLACLALKLPSGLLLGILLSATSFAWLRTGPRRLVFLVVPPIVFFLAASYSRIDLGIRVVLPAVVFLYVFAARPLASRLGSAFTAVCIAWCAWSASNQRHPLAYFNEFAGSRPERMLADSNLDWGQGLPALRDYMEHEKIDAVYLSYFGTDRPESHGIRYQTLPGSGRIGAPGGEPIPASAPRHVVAISANNLLGIYLHDRETFAFLRDRTPDHILAGSIFVFDLTNDSEALRLVRAAP